jgi:uncharacterized protein with FMN-binding domain
MPPENNMNKSKKNIGVALSILVILGVLSATIFLGKKPTDTASVDQTTVSATNQPTIPLIPATPAPKTALTPPVDVPKKSASIYKDGTYSATGSYMSPGGPDQIGVNVTLKNDIITDVNATPEAGDNTSARYQNKFISGYKAYVLGKNIASVYLTKVSGSSLTPKGFNDAIAQIKVQAKA